MMKQRSELEKYQSDMERYAHLHEVSFLDWDLVSDWESEAESDDMRRVFHERRVRLCHLEEGFGVGEI